MLCKLVDCGHSLVVPKLLRLREAGWALVGVVVAVDDSHGDYHDDCLPPAGYATGLEKCGWMSPYCPVQIKVISTLPHDYRYCALVL